MFIHRQRRLLPLHQALPAVVAAVHRVHPCRQVVRQVAVVQVLVAGLHLRVHPVRHRAVCQVLHPVLVAVPAVVGHRLHQVAVRVVLLLLVQAAQVVQVPVPGHLHQAQVVVLLRVCRQVVLQAQAQVVQV